MEKHTKFVMCGAGIFICYFYFGIMQEKVTRGKYVYQVKNVDGKIEQIEERYTCALALVFIQCLINYIFAKGMLYTWPSSEDKSPKMYSGISALTYLLAMICSTMALQWVPYPTQVVGKAGKPIPVMILGVLIGNKSYALKKYLFVLLIVVGVVLFMYKDKVSLATSENAFGLGELLLILSLLMDGLTGAVQERWRACSKPTGQQMMRAMNGWSCILLALPMVLSGEIFDFTTFILRHPSVIYHISLLALAGAFGQLFIFLTVSDFGPLPCSIITTTRKFFTVLGSVIFFGNKLIARQWVGAVIVFSGLFLDAYFSKSAPKKKQGS